MQDITFSTIRSSGLFRRKVTLLPLPCQSKVATSVPVTSVDTLAMFPGLTIASWNCNADVSQLIRERSLHIIDALAHLKPAPEIIALQEVTDDFLATLFSSNSVFTKSCCWAISHATVTNKKRRSANVILVNVTRLTLLRSCVIDIPIGNVPPVVMVTVCGKPGSHYEGLPETQIMSLQLEQSSDSTFVRQEQLHYLQSFSHGQTSFLCGDFELHQVEEDYLPERLNYEDCWRKLKISDLEGHTVPVRIHQSNQDPNAPKIYKPSARFDRIVMKASDPYSVKERLVPVMIKTFGSLPLRFRMPGNPLVFPSNHLGVSCQFKLARY